MILGPPTIDTSLVQGCEGICQHNPGIFAALQSSQAPGAGAKIGFQGSGNDRMGADLDPNDTFEETIRFGNWQSPSLLRNPQSFCSVAGGM